MRYLFYSGEGPWFGGYSVLWHADNLEIGDCQPEVLHLRLYDWQGGRDCVMAPENQWLSWRIVNYQGECVARHQLTGPAGDADNWLAALDRSLSGSRADMGGIDPRSYRVYLAGELELDVPEECRHLLEQADFHLDYTLGFRGPGGEPLPEARQGASGLFGFYEREDGILRPKTTAGEIIA